MHRCILLLFGRVWPCVHVCVSSTTQYCEFILG